MSSQELISVISPSLNMAQYLESTIQSVLYQDYPAIEYLVIDGGSSDETVSILDQYQEKLQWRLEPDLGQAAAINKGWRLSSGGILAWLNCDDTYLPGSIARIGRYFDDHPDVDMVYGDCLLTNEVGESIGEYPTQPFDYQDLVRLAINYIPQPATFIRRRVIEETGYLNEDLDFLMDYDFWLRIGMRHTVAYLPDALATLRIHRSAKSLRELKKFGPELIGVFKCYFENRKLRPALKELERETMRNAYIRAADSSFWGGAYALSLSAGIKAFLLAPLQPSRWLIALLGLTILGPLGGKFAELRFGNPYRKHQGW